MTATSSPGAPSLDGEGAPVSRISRGYAWALALTATLTMSVSYVDRQTLAVLAPTVTKALAISEQSYGWLVSAFSFAYLVGAPLAGRFIDRVCARRGLLGAVLVWSGVAALHALVPGFLTLFALRIALGFAEAPSFPGSAQTVHRALPPHDRPRGLGILFTGSSIGAMIAPPLATYFEARLGWRVAFLVTAVVGLAWVPLWLRVAFSREGRRALDVRPATTASASSRSPSYGELLLHPAVLRAVVLVLASAPQIAFVLNWSAKYLVRELGLTQRQVGSYLWLPPLLFDAGAVAFGHIASRRIRVHGGEPERGLVAAATLLALAGAAMPLAPGPWATVLVAGVALAGGGALFALLTADMLARVPPSAISTAGGITAAAQSLAYIVANPLIGRAVEGGGSYAPVVVALGLWVVPGAAVWMMWRPPPPWREASVGTP